MSQLLLARLQFAVTTVYHFFFVPLTIGLIVLIAIIETQYVVTGNEDYKKMAKFWGKLFLINFAMGVVTGIVQEFQFGMAWSEYSRFVGDVFGAPLAIEGLLAFFLESTFIGIWIFGWDKLSKKMHLAAAWLAAIGTILSSLWILAANSFMQHPVGYEIIGGRAEMQDFMALLANPYLWRQFPHVITSALTTGGFFMLGISSYHLLKKSEFQSQFIQSFKVAAIVGLVGVIGVVGAGHAQMVWIFEAQPMKAASAEALYETEDPASLSLFSLIDEEARKETFAIRLPGMTSFLLYMKPEGEARGINDLQAEYEELYGPGNYIPPVTLNFWSFRAMVGAGMLMLLFAALAMFFIIRGKVATAPKLFLKVLIPTLLMPYLANTAGWLLTETGRQPWLVFGLLKTETGITPSLTQVDLGLSLAVFTLVYGVLLLADVYLLYKYARKGPSEETAVVDGSAQAADSPAD